MREWILWAVLALSFLCILEYALWLRREKARRNRAGGDALPLDTAVPEDTLSNGADPELRVEGQSGLFGALAWAIAKGGRESQQDALAAVLREDCAGAVLCDGMGGLEGGALASRETVEVFRAVLAGHRDLSQLRGSLRQALDEADRKVACLTDEAGRTLRAGTTLVCAVLREGELTWLSVGDSRIYLFRDGALRCLTRDHNYLLELRRAVAAGEMDIEEARAVRRKDALISYVGMNGVALADMSSSPSPLEPGDLVLLTSDGLVKALPEAEIAAVLLEQGTDLTACAGTLLHRALARGGPRQDNTSLVLLRQGPASAEAGEA